MDQLIEYPKYMEGTWRLPLQETCGDIYVEEGRLKDPGRSRSWEPGIKEILEAAGICNSASMGGQKTRASVGRGTETAGSDPPASQELGQTKRVADRVTICW